MYVRIASFEGGDTERLRQMNDDRMSSGTLDAPAGMKRILLLEGKDSDKRLFISFFDSRDEIEAAEQRFESMGDEIPEEVRGRRTSVEVYEVVTDREL
jgi:HAMP domain-containing protein